MITAERLDRDALAAVQGQRLSELVTAIYGRNAFYTRKFEEAGLADGAAAVPARPGTLPLTTKAELNADQPANPPWGTALTEPLERYTRYCQTSSTTGRPLRWIDTNESWQFLLDCWKAVYRGAQVGIGDRVFFPFSFGPFLGFWAGFEAGHQMGLHCIPGGGMSSQIRLALIESSAPLSCAVRATYALRLAEIAQHEHPLRPLAESTVRVDRGRRTWRHSADERADRAELGRPCDRSLRADGSRSGELRVLGGAWVPARQRRAVHRRSARPRDSRPVADGEHGELVVTNLGRTASR